MKVKRTKQTSTQLCEWCRRDGKKVRATWKYFGQHACDEHKDKIHVDDGYMSEADYQTWGRL